MTKKLNFFLKFVHYLYLYLIGVWAPERPTMYKRKKIKTVDIVCYII